MSVHCVLQGKLCWVLQCLAVLLGLGGVANRLANAQTLQVRQTDGTQDCLAF